jgi:hypothetical protein
VLSYLCDRWNIPSVQLFLSSEQQMTIGAVVAKIFREIFLNLLGIGHVQSGLIIMLVAVVARWYILVRKREEHHL